MGKGSEDSNNQLSKYSWNEVKRHDNKNDLWIVIDKYVYDITKFQKVHPGGARVVNFYSGQDATEAFIAFHKDEVKTKKYMNLYRIGVLEDNSFDMNENEVSKSNDENRKYEIKNDFEKIRKVAIEMNLFKPKVLFYIFHALHILVLNILGFYILNKFGSGFLPVLVAFICQTIAQAQSDWTQHDYGHLSVFKNSNMNRYMHLFFMGFVKGASSHWWNHMHNQHHAKPNVIDKDPDVRIDPIFVLGEVQPKRTAEKNAKDKKSLIFPYNYQHRYFFIFAPLLFPSYFQIMTFRHAIVRRLHVELAVMITMYVIFFSLTMPVLGIFGSILYFFLLRIAESAWFTWVSQSNHIVMDVHEEDDSDTWLSLQLKATCNIERSWFNDWFTGHLNMQIEHHLFPTMPRHNLYKIQPMVESLCKKHGIKYVTKPIGKAFGDIMFSLKKSGEMWQEAYEELLQAI